MSTADDAWQEWYIENDQPWHHGTKAAFMAGAAWALGDAAAKLAEAFSGDDYTENAEDAASEGEWSWFKWLAMTTLDPAWPNNDRAAGVGGNDESD